MSGMRKDGGDKPRPIQEEGEQDKLKRQGAQIFSKPKGEMFKNMLKPKPGTPTYDDTNKNKGARPRKPTI